MKVPFLLVGLLWVVSAAAQGTYLYTWHGNSGIFQASFQVTPEENQPGGYFESQTFYGSIVFTSPDSTFVYSWPASIASGRMGPPFDLSFLLDNSETQRELFASADSSFAIIKEYDLQTHAQLLFEAGSWGLTYLTVPEPSSGSLLGLSAFAWLFYKRKGDLKATLSRQG